MNRLRWLLVCAWMTAALGHSIGATVAAAPVDMRLPPETAKLKASTVPGYAIASQKCFICHSVDYISFQPPAMTQKQWTAEVVKMQHVYGAPIDDAEVKLLAVYLTTAYGDASSVSGDDR